MRRDSPTTLVADEQIIAAIKDLETKAAALRHYRSTFDDASMLAGLDSMAARANELAAQIRSTWAGTVKGR